MTFGKTGHLLEQKYLVVMYLYIKSHNTATKCVPETNVSEILCLDSA